MNGTTAEFDCESELFKLSVAPGAKLTHAIVEAEVAGQSKVRKMNYVVQWGDDAKKSEKNGLAIGSEAAPFSASFLGGGTFDLLIYRNHSDTIPSLQPQSSTGICQMKRTSKNQSPVKDEDGAHPIAHVWRPTLRIIVSSICQRDYSLARKSRLVGPVSSATAEQIEAYITEYGETLCELSEESWDTSIAQWMETYWLVLVDLWTVESGESDLVLQLDVFETEEGYRFDIKSVCVP